MSFFSFEHIIVCISLFVPVLKVCVPARLLYSLTLAPSFVFLVDSNKGYSRSGRSALIQAVDPCSKPRPLRN
jgi:hypothetical protein